MNVFEPAASGGAGVTEKSHHFADRVAMERNATASRALDAVSSDVVASILAHSDREQAATLLDVLNDAGAMTISTALMVSAQLMANVLRTVEKTNVASYLGGVVRLSLAIVEEHRQLALLSDSVPAGEA